MSMHTQMTLYGNFIYIETSGEFSLDKALVNVKKAIAFFIEHKTIDKVITDCLHLTGSLSTVQRFEYAIFLVERMQEAFVAGVSRDIKFAYVMPEALVDLEHFSETVARNRGLHLKIFNTMEDALEWLELKETVLCEMSV